jgi:phosphatidyl-myo-inositol dimannoside synthase
MAYPMSRLLFLSREFPPGPGGIGTHAWQLSVHLAGLGWEVSVISPQDYAADADIETFNAAQPFPMTRLPSGRSPVVEALHRRKVLARRIREWSPDVLVASGQRSVWLAGAVARGSMAWVAVAHGSEFGGGRLSRSATAWAFGRATKVVCVSQFTRRVMEGAGVRPRGVAVIPNGADAGRFHLVPSPEVEAFRAQHGLGASRVLVTVGQVTERKGQDVVIRAMPRLLHSVPDALYLIVGMPTRQAELMSLAISLGVSERVRFLGRIGSDDLVRCLNAADVFVMTSRRTAAGDCEGFGIAVVEAALCGKPAVVSDNSGLAEAISDGETGLGVPENDSDATADALGRLLSDGVLRARMAHAALDRAHTEQTWDIRAREYDVLLRGLLGAR